jgi:hypothetical protein
MREAKHVTKADLAACRKIEVCGWIGIAEDGPWLESNAQIGQGRFERLKTLGLVEASGDGLIAGATQTYRLADGWDVSQETKGRDTVRLLLPQAPAQPDGR